MQLRKLTKPFVNGKTVLYRAPYDVSIVRSRNKFGMTGYSVKDTSRIDVTIPTLKFLLSQNCKIVIVTWVQRPKGKDKSLSTRHIAKVLQKHLKQKIQFIDDCIGEKTEEKIKSLKPKDILLLENTRFYKEDLTENMAFAKKLCKGSDVIVFDAFPQAHRKASSVTGILKVLPSVSGLYLVQEAKSLEKLITKPKHPFTLVIGGAKISDKIEAIKNLIKICDHVLIGGGPAHLFLKAKGVNIGNSLIEDTYLDENLGRKIKPLDVVISLLTRNEQKMNWAEDFILKSTQKNKTPKESVKTINLNEYRSIPAGYSALDIGPKSTKKFIKIIEKSKTVFWAGPLGQIEDKRFINGTKAIAKAIANNKKALTVACGGDTVVAINQFRLYKKFTHVSLAGGAALEFLAGKELPALKLLKVK